MYAVKEIFYTLQGEGVHTGRPAVFCRFAGCNLWSGHEADRADAVCKFCDTEFVGTDGTGGGKFSATGLALAVYDAWKGKPMNRFVVCTGGEPLLQIDEALIDAVHDLGFEIAVETNGTVKVPRGLDWVCVSPKAGSRTIAQRGNELKVVYPQDIDPRVYEEWDFDHFYIQPMDGPDFERNQRLAIEFCQRNTQWRLSTQTHKLIGLR